MLPETLQMIVAGGHPKGDVFAVARIAGIQAAKKTSDLIPLCHPLMLTSVKVETQRRGRRHREHCRPLQALRTDRRGNGSADRCQRCGADDLRHVQGGDRGMVIENVRLLEKLGGKSGHFVADAQEDAQ
jgi:cyclic pyranopterin phosphate synthase